jgi:hypothetical protein
VAAPIDYLSSRLNQAQGEYNINKAAEQSFIETIAKVRGREEDLPALRNISSAYENALTGIAEKVNRDYGSANYRQELQKLAGNLRTDLAQGDLYAINSNFNTYQAYQKQVSETKDTYNPYLDSQYTNIAPGFYQGYKSPTGYNISRLGAIDKAINREEVADNIIKGIGAIGGTNIKISKDDFGNDVILTEKGERVSEDKIRSTFRPAIVNTQAFDQIQREADYEAKVAARQGREFDRNSFVAKSVGQLEDFVVNKYTRSNSQRSIDFHNIPEYQQTQNGTPTYTPSRNGAALSNPNLAPALVDPTTAFGNITRDSKLTGYGSAKVGITNAEDLERPTMDKAQLDQAKTDFNNTVNTNIQRLKSNGFDFNKTTYLEAYNKARKDLVNVTLPGVQINPKQAETYQALLNNSKASSLYTIGGEQLTINQIAEKYNVKPEEIEVNPSLIHYDSVDPNHKGGNMEVTLHIKGKEYVPAIVPLNDNFTAETAIVSEIGQNSIYKGQDTYTESNPLYDPQRDSDIYTVTAPKKQYSAGKELPFETTVIIAPRNGSAPIKVPYNTFKEIYGSQAVNKLQNTMNSSQTIAPKDYK